jgi:hypothetical protein
MPNNNSEYTFILSNSYCNSNNNMLNLKSIDYIKSLTLSE